MATRYYLTTRSPGVDYRAPIHGPWNATQWGERLHGYQNWTWLLSTSKTDGGASQTWTVGETNDTPDWDVLFARWITPPLEAQTISGTFDVALGVARTDDASTAVFKVYIYITVGDTDEVRHVLLDYTDTTLWDLLVTIRALAAAQALTSGDAEAGDHVVVELGVRFANADPADDLTVFDTQGFLRIGTTNGVAGAALADNVVGSFTLDAAYVDFSHTFVEQAAPAAPAHDACTDATVIAAIPYVDSVDTTQSADTNRAVWYQWVADTDDPVIIRTWGSNYRVQIDVYSGTCGALGFSLASSAQSQWIQGSQAAVKFTPSIGTTYRIRLQSATATLVSARNSGGALRLTISRYAAPQADDLFVNCQHLTCWRDGELINFNTTLFYGLTPTGAAIDDTKRPLLDFNGGTHVTDRLLVVLFGFSLVEFVDLATLNTAPGDSEITFIALDEDADQPVPTADVHPSSLIMDRAGDILVGFFGDGYDVIGTLSTPNTAWPRRVDGTLTVTNFPGVEVDVTATYEVEQDVMGSDYIELAADQRTLFYTSAGQRVLRYDLTNEVQLTDFATVPTAPGPRPGLRGGRLLPPGDGSGGMLVTNGSEVVRLDADGVVIQTYQPAASHRAQDLDKVELTQSGTTFWVSDQLSASLFHFDLETGAELADIDTGMPSGQLSGFVIYQGFRAGLEEPPEEPPDEEEEPPEPPVEVPVACPVDLPNDPGGGGCGSGVAFFP